MPRRRNAKCKICESLFCPKDGGRQGLCAACCAKTSSCEICGATMPKYAKKHNSPIRHTCSQKCHNTRVSRMEHVRDGSRQTAKDTFERQKKNPEYMEQLRTRASQLHTFHGDNFGSKASARLLENRSTPNGRKKWEDGYYSSRPDAVEKIKVANKRNWENKEFREKQLTILRIALDKPEVKAKRTASVKRAYAEGRIVPLRGNTHIVLNRTKLERAIELPLYLSNIPYIRNLRIWRYYIDFAIPEVMIGIECDGKYWHDKNTEKDKKRDAYLLGRGWTIIRLTEVEIKNDPISALSAKVIPMLESALKTIVENQIEVVSE